MKIKNIYRIKVFSILFYFIILFGTIKLAGDVKVYLDPMYSTEADGKDIQLTAESLIYPDFPKPKNHLPVLFVHGHYDGRSKDKNFRKHWQQSLNGLPCFQETLELAENSWLGIEPYYIDLEEYKNVDEKKNRSIEEDARKIKEAVELILLHQDDPAAKTRKVVIIAYGSGAVSARYFLKDLWENQNKRLAFHPVSEFIAISPPNHGLNAANDFIQSIGQDSLAFKQLNNGRDENGTRFTDPRSHDFIEKLNGHAIRDTLMAHYCGQIFDSEAPGSRRNNEPIEKGILYVTFYAKGNRDIVGGSDPSDDCQGRVLAKNLAPNAVNREIPGIPGNMSCPEIPGGDDKQAVHQNTVHMPEVICKALYTAVFHQAPPDELIFKGTDADEKYWMSPPIVPQLQLPEQEAGIVLILDISGSMSHLLPRIKRAVEPFMKLLNDYCYDSGKADVGISVFPPLPWSFQNQKACNGQVIHPMTNATETNIDHAIKTVNCLQAQGNSPLLNGIDTALQLFGQESRKAIILLSDGNYNCPGAVNSHDAAVNDCIKDLEKKQVTLYSIGCGQDFQLNHKLLRRLAEERQETLKGTFIQAMDAPLNSYNYNYNDKDNHGGWNPETSLNKAFLSIFTDLLKLEEVKDHVGMIKAEETKTFDAKVNGHNRKISFVLNWVIPQEGRLGLTIKTSDGKTIPNGRDALNFHLHQGETYTIITMDEHFLKQSGKVGAAPWTVYIDAPGLKDGERETYQYSVIMDSALKMRTEFNKPFYETGDTITFFGAITEGNGKRPKTSLTDFSVKVTRPGEGPGNWYASNKVSADALASIPETIGNDSISLLHRKAMFLKQKRKAGGFQRTRPKVLHFPLYDDGTHGDKKKGDGIYTNQYKSKETIIEGTYSFQFHASGNEVWEPFEREKTVQQYVAVKPDPDPEYSRLRIDWNDMFRDERVEYLYDVEFVPKDRFGNYMGPGHRVDVKIVYNKHKYEYEYEGDSNHLIQLKDNLDGTYIGKIRISRSGFKTGVRLVFFIDGKPFTTVEKIPGFKKRSLGIYAGIGIPTYSFNRTHNPAINLGCHIGYRIAPQFSLIGLVGYNPFGSGSSGTDDTLWWNISGNLKSEIVKNPFRIYVNVGPGIYISKTGALKRGFNVGAGAAYSLTSKYIIEIGADFHRVYIEGIDPHFLMTYARLVYRF